MTGEAAQKADPDDPDRDEKMNLAHGGTPCSCGMGADCGCDGLVTPYRSVQARRTSLMTLKLISQGKYVLPANVVKWHGLKHIMSLQNEAEEPIETPEGNQIEIGCSRDNL